MRALSACAAVVAAFLTTPALAQQCGPVDAIVDALAAEYREQVVGQGISGRGALIKVYANPETGTWTVIAVLPSGTACVLDGGAGWEIIAPVLGRPS